MSQDLACNCYSLFLLQVVTSLPSRQHARQHWKHAVQSADGSQLFCGSTYAFARSNAIHPKSVLLCRFETIICCHPLKLRDGFLLDLLICQRLRCQLFQPFIEVLAWLVALRLGLGEGSPAHLAIHDHHIFQIPQQIAYSHKLLSFTGTTCTVCATNLYLHNATILCDVTLQGLPIAFSPNCLIIYHLRIVKRLHDVFVVLSIHSKTLLVPCGLNDVSILA
mmetsp:Transcript_25603/g.48445  ORF Transcript_25603/g.48445 Transcript_25603/m.48445 type:complete len:221 (-) Transcript_25603:31-693(-)